ncbi:MAG: M36 family metallopeptidase [Blastocatellia bacterium]
MKRTTLWILAAIVVALLASSSLLWNSSMQAAGPAGQGTQGRSAASNPEKENFDIRNREFKEAVSKFERRMEKLSSSQKEKNDSFKQAMKIAEGRKARSVEGLKVTFSSLTNSPEIVEMGGEGRKFLTPPSSQPLESIVRGFINDNADLFGMNPQQVASLEKSAEYTNPNGRLSWLRMEQQWNGMKVFRGEMLAAFTSDGEMARIVSGITRGPEEQELETAPKVSAAAAVVAAAASVDVTLTESALIVKEASPDGRTVVFRPAGPFTDDIKLDLQYFPLDAGLATLAWSMVLWQDSPAYYTLVDAETGDLLWRKNIVNDQTQSATYRVYDGDNPAPLSPTTSLPGAGVQGAAIARTLFTLISEGAFNNLGWLTDGVKTTTGNNVDAGLDLAAPNGIDSTGRPTSATRVFDFTYNPAPGIPAPGEAPTLADYRFGEVVNMFFWSNRYHDRLYQLGFTEAARNFQQDNFDRGGLGNDRVLAEAQDFSGTNNANFATPPDGTSGRMQMFIFTGPDPDRSSGLDQELLIHELTHGTSNRLHSNAAGLSATMSGGMGEGWSDFYALALLAQPGDDPLGIYGVMGYSLLQITSGFTDNYYYGFRRFPYATIATVGPNGRPHNPLTFADIDPKQINITDGAFPRGPIGLPDAFAVHNIGEVWCSALWEVRARIIARLGFAAGSQRTLQLVTDGMQLDPVNPTLLDGRNSILTATCAAFNGEDELDIWAGFAARGIGLSASAVSSSSPTVVEAFDVPNLNLGAVTITDDSCTPDGFVDPGETLTLNIPISNPFCATPANGVTISVNGGSPVSYGDIPAGATVSRGVPFTVPSDAVCGSQLPIKVVITSSLGTAPRTFNLQIGRPADTRTANYSSGNIAVPIPDVSTVNIPINVTDVGAVVDVNVRVRLNHTADSDLRLTLIGPDGTTVALVNNRGVGDDNFGTGANDCSGVPTVFDDSAPIAISAGVSPFAGSFSPESPLAAFNGKPVNGVWILKVADTVAADVGTVGCVTLEINRQRFTCKVTRTTVPAVAGQFSDVVMLKANVTNAVCPGGSIEFKVNGSVVGSAPVTSGTATLPFTISLAQGNYPIVATHSISGSSGSGTLTVTREDAIVTPSASNPTTVKVNSRRGTAGPINLCAAINETHDESPGDIALATPVTFTLRPVAPGTPPITQTAATSGGGVGGTLTACVTLNNVRVNTYDVVISVGGNHYTGSGSDLLGVFDPSLRPFRGAGSIVRGDVTSTFIFSVKHKKSNPQGGLIYIEHRPNRRAALQSNSVRSISVVGNTGVIIGKATLNGVRNHTFRATIVDGGKSGRNDRFGLQVISPSGAIIPDLTFDPIILKSGNIKR